MALEMTAWVTKTQSLFIIIIKQQKRTYYFCLIQHSNTLYYWECCHLLNPRFINTLYYCHTKQLGMFVIY
jgi:hypothetical protein